MKAVFENIKAEVDQNAVDKKCGEIERRNLLIMNENLIAECLSKDVFYTATDSVLNVSRFSDMHDALTIAQNRIADLESENFNLRNKIQNDDHDSMIKHFSKLEVEHFNLQLKYQNLKERFGNKKPVTSLDDPSFDSLDADPIFNPKALVSQNKDLTAKTKCPSRSNDGLGQKNAKTQLKGKMPCVTIDVKTPKVSAFEKYAIDVELIPPHQRSNRNVHHGYLNSLKDTLDTLHEIVEEARSELPSDRVNTATIASRSKPRSNTKKDKTLPAKSVPKKKVEDHPRNNKSKLSKKNQS
ncbi:hypothetical protein Tco_0701327 [Tanacetum coccineum]